MADQISMTCSGNTNHAGTPRRPKVYYEPAAAFGTGFHCEGPDGADYTLCGYSLDGDQGAIAEVTSAPPRIDCERCLAIIHFCRGMSARAFKSAGSPS